MALNKAPPSAKGRAGVAVLGEDRRDLLGDVADASQSDFLGHAAEGADVVFEHGFDGEGDVTTVLAPFAGLFVVTDGELGVFSAFGNDREAGDGAGLQPLYILQVGEVLDGDDLLPPAVDLGVIFPGT